MSVVDQVRIGMIRKKFHWLLGQPADTGHPARKYRTPGVYRYGSIEFHFEPWATGRLVRVYTEDVASNGMVLLK